VYHSAFHLTKYLPHKINVEISPHNSI